ncbi:MAG: 50S ribosomal protein L16 [Bacteroidetes bacterium]|nr:50S ribosomal protein L16 [Bacteroidota bacterium]
MLQPKKTKFRKMHKMVPSGNARRGTTLAFGSFGLKSVETAWITARQIEAARVALTRHIGREAKVWIRIFPDKPITKKPAEVRMGKGKGNPEYWVAVVKAGRVMFETEGTSLETAKEAMKLAGDKLPCISKFMVRNDFLESINK